MSFNTPTNSRGDKDIRVALLTHSTIGPSETFLRAHVDRLPFHVLHGVGYGTRFEWLDTVTAKKILIDAELGPRWLNLLPHFFEFRIRRRYFPSPTEDERLATELSRLQIDVVLAEYGTTAAFVAPACRLADIPLVAHFHGFDASRYDTLEQFGDRYRVMFAHAKRVISVSGPMTNALRELGCPREKILENPYGPADAFFEIEPDYHSNTIIAVGRHTAQKAPYLTLEAFRRAHLEMPNLRLELLGAGELFEVSRRLVQAWGLDDAVTLHGVSTPEEIRSAMARSFAFVQHSVRADNGEAEGMPVAILEAGAAALPVVSTRHAGIPESVAHEDTGLLSEPGDVSAMTAHLLKLARDRNLARRMGERARQRIRSKFSMARHIDCLAAALCQSALESGASRITGGLKMEAAQSPL